MPLQGASDVYPQHMVSWRSKKNINMVEKKKNAIFTVMDYNAFHIGVLILKAPITTAADDNYYFFFFFSMFQRKQILKFHVNRLLGRWFTWSVKTCFLWKIKKKSRMSSATNFARNFKVNIMLLLSTTGIHLYLIMPLYISFEVRNHKFSTSTT